MLSGAFGGVIEMLQITERWCDDKAAARYDQARRALTTERAGWDSPETSAKWCAAQADLWFRRKAVLIEAIGKLKEIR